MYLQIGNINSESKGKVYTHVQWNFSILPLRKLVLFEYRPTFLSPCCAFLCKGHPSKSAIFIGPGTGQFIEDSLYMRDCIQDRRIIFWDWGHGNYIEKISHL
jgi:hypothetical protein